MVYVTFLTGTGQRIAIDPRKQRATFQAFQDGLIAESRLGEPVVSYQKYRLKRGCRHRPDCAPITIVRSVQRELDRLRDAPFFKLDENLLTLTQIRKPIPNKPKSFKRLFGDLRMTKIGDFSVVYTNDGSAGNLRVLLVRIGRWIPHQSLAGYFVPPEKKRMEMRPAERARLVVEHNRTNSFVGYSGETAKELFSYPADGQHAALIAGFREAIQRKVAKKGDRSLTAPERVVLTVAALEEEVNNGGFDQFFRNSSRNFSGQIANSLRRIRCPRIAEIADRAVKTLRVPKLNAATIRASMSVDSAERDEKLEQCDELFYKAQMQHNIAKRLYEFISLNKKAMKF